MFHYMFKAEFVTLVSPVGGGRDSVGLPDVQRGGCILHTNAVRVRMRLSFPNEQKVDRPTHNTHVPFSGGRRARSA